MIKLGYMRKTGKDSQEETIKGMPEHHHPPCQKREIIRLPSSFKGHWHKKLRTFIRPGESGIMEVDHRGRQQTVQLGGEVGKG
jgi:hypothetical protein